MDVKIQLLLAWVFPVCSLAGIAEHLRSGRPITIVQILSVVLNAGLFGSAMALLMWHRLGEENIALILGVSILTGLGANALIVFLVEITKKAFVQLLNRHLKIQINGKHDDKVD